MPKDDDLLRKITTFPKLVEYLRDELQWPIDVTSFDDLTFEYEAEELGLDPKIAVKIHSIKQLRPLTARQPWGVFFVEFERKRLPVVVMRRILSALALKRRASAGKSSQAAWQASDLLFVSSFGEEGGRGITFAHFAPDEEGHDLPALKVLGWDGDDTKLHTQAVAESLASNLTWPLDEKDVNAWRTQWASAFVLANREVAETSRELSIQLAKLAVGIRERAKALLASESDRGPLRRLHKAFKEALLHDLSEDGFADMYAQTIAYGLLAARLENPDSPTPLIASALADMIPVTSPFLKGLLSTFLKVGGRKGYLDFDELGIGDVVDLLRNAKMGAILLDFGDLKPEEDPVLHFYELFLNEYDHAQKMKRGVFYTPKPVVHYIVHSIDEILRTEFGLADGLADTTTWGEMAMRRPDITVPVGVAPGEPFVQVLDPATGTATFLVEVIDVIYSTMAAKWRGQGMSKAEIETLWNEYVPRHLLPRLHGFEIQMAPYTIAHIKFGLKLRETGYRFGSTERSRIYLTNTLEDPDKFADRLPFDVPALADEARSVNAVKRSLQPTVVLGNPPYAGVSSNPAVDERGQQTLAGWLIEEYKTCDGRPLGEKNPKMLQDDYVKFMRFAQWKIDRAGVGILGLITNHSYLDNLTFRGMRQSLMKSFDQLHIFDLHGNSLKKEKCPDGSKDENVFDIMRGVAILLGTKRKELVRGIWQEDLWGTRDDKYKILGKGCGAQTAWRELKPRGELYLFVPQDSTLAAEYEGSPRLIEIFESHNVGIVTSRDTFVVDIDRETLRTRIELFRNPAISDEEARVVLGLEDTTAWQLHVARDAVRNNPLWQESVIPILYRPFDRRWLFYDDAVVDRMRREVMRHMTADNIGLCAMRQVSLEGGFSHVLVTSSVVDNRTFVSSKGLTELFPLYCCGIPTSTGTGASKDRGESRSPRRANLNSQVLARVTTRVGFRFVPDGQGKLPVGLMGPEDLFAYIYAILYSPAYRTRYSEFLKTDFARVPFTGDRDLFIKLAGLGRQLIDMHLVRSPDLDNPVSYFCGKGDGVVTKVVYDAARERVSINPTQYFDGVAPDVWSYQIGGYQVLLKWLKDRGPKGGEPSRVLSPDDILHYRKVVTAIAKTIELQAEIDRVIAAAGGFPAAFAPPQVP